MLVVVHVQCLTACWRSVCSSGTRKSVGRQPVCIVLCCWCVLCGTVCLSGKLSATKRQLLAACVLSVGLLSGAITCAPNVDLSLRCASTGCRACKSIASACVSFYLAFGCALRFAVCWCCALSFVCSSGCVLWSPDAIRFACLVHVRSVSSQLFCRDECGVHLCVALRRRWQRSIFSGTS
jgi:hypothetical protein